MEVADDDLSVGEARVVLGFRDHERTGFGDGVGQNPMFRDVSMPQRPTVVVNLIRLLSSSVTNALRPLEDISDQVGDVVEARLTRVCPAG